jgi:glycerophosphoryl diester phosphodiesterase
LDRTTNTRGVVSRLRLSEVRAADAGKGEHVPTLAEVLDHFPAVAVILEIKDPSASPAIQRVLADHHAQARVLLGSFEHRALAPFGAGWLRSASRWETAIFWAAARFPGVRWRGRYGAFTVPERHGRLQVVDQSFAGLARRMAVPVHVWTVDEAVQAERLRAMGVCGLITNYPARMRAAGF